MKMRSSRLQSLLPIGLFLSLLCLLTPACQKQKENTEGYEPIPLFAPAYDALGKAGGTDYNLDATIRAIRAFEIAGTESDSFESFLELLTKQDYRYVASDVIEAERKLFPIMQRLYLKEQECKDLEGVWAILKGSENQLMEMGMEFLAAGTFDLTGFLAARSLFSAVNTAFDNYSKNQDLKESTQKELNEIKSQYYAAIQETWPVFIKYKEEWEKLCLKKDEAYMDIYSGGITKSYNLASEILDKYPEDRDALLIKALSILNRKTFDPSAALEVESTLKQYESLFPVQVAPALLIRGILATRDGKEKEAFQYFDQAATQYPRQAVLLTDMLDAYTHRPYFTLTKEGLYFQQMYKSTLEGYGFFSPNFQKALYYERKGMLKEAGEEIYAHFFRRGNQDVFDYLLSDLEFCEQYLSDSFSQSFPESDFLDLSVSTNRKLLVGKKQLQVTLANNTDKPLENVRCFLCHHLVDMYPGDYVVVKLPSVNSIPGGENYQWTTDEYEPDKIVNTRGILITDNRVVWVDTRENKQRKADEPEEAFPTSHLDIDRLISANQASIYAEIDRTSLSSGELQMFTKYLIVHIPRSLSVINPVFSMGESSDRVYPEHSVVKGEEIIAYFPLRDTSGKMILHIQAKGKHYDVPVPVTKAP